VKGPAADATDAPQPWGLLWNLVMIMINFFRFSVQWSTGGMKLTGRKPKYSGKTLSQCHFVYHKYHMDWPRIEAGPPRWIFLYLNIIPTSSSAARKRTWSQESKSSREERPTLPPDRAIAKITRVEWVNRRIVTLAVRIRNVLTSSDSTIGLVVGVLQ
jgi:hypothetical protein